MRWKPITEFHILSPGTGCACGTTYRTALAKLAEAVLLLRFSRQKGARWPCLACVPPPALDNLWVAHCEAPHWNGLQTSEVPRQFLGNYDISMCFTDVWGHVAVNNIKSDTTDTVTFPSALVSKLNSYISFPLYPMG